MPSERVQILHDRQELTLHLVFCDRVLFPVFRILLILEHVDTCMSDVWELTMQFLDSCESLSWFHKREAENEVYIERNV